MDILSEKFSWVDDLADPTAPPFLKRTEADVGFVGAIDFGDDQFVGEAVLPNKKAIVRDCYHQLNQTVWKLFGKNVKIVGVSGTPGTGKTVFGMLFLIDLVRAIRKSLVTKEELPLGLTQPVVFYKVAAVTSYFQITIGVDNLSVVKVGDELVPKNSIVIKDGECEVFDVQCKQLVLSTPKAPKMREFLKHHPLYYLPQWQTSDMIMCWKLIGGPDVGKDVFFGPLAKDMWQDVKTTCEASGFDVNSIEFKEMMWRRLIKELGHVPRRIFNPVTSLAQRDTELRALKQPEVQYFLSLVGQPLQTAIDHEPKFPHALLSIAVEDWDDLRTLVIVPATKLMATRIIQSGAQDQLTQARMLMGRQTGCCLGKSFEPYAILVLSTPGKHHIRKLDEDKEEELVMVHRHPQEVPNSAFPAGVGPLAPDVMYTPQDPTFPCIDAWTATDMFQMKVGSTKDAKTGAPRFKRVRHLVTNKRIIYVVPKGHGASFKYVPQTVPHSVEEWVLELALDN